MTAYLAISKDGEWCQILTAVSHHALFWGIDEFSDPYSFAFKPVENTPMTIEVPLAKEYVDDTDWSLIISKDRDTSIGEWVEDEIMSFLMGQSREEWLHFTNDAQVESYTVGVPS